VIRATKGRELRHLRGAQPQQPCAGCDNETLDMTLWHHDTGYHGPAPVRGAQPMPQVSG
jgi:hypothetical protein